MRYSILTQTDNHAIVKLGSHKIGRAWRNANTTWSIVVDAHPTIRNRIEKTAKTRADAFFALVQSLNRIELCGEDNADKAQAALDARNAMVRNNINEFNNLVGANVVRLKRRKINI
jgi:hypothetical protein